MVRPPAAGISRRFSQHTPTLSRYNAAEWATDRLGGVVAAAE